MIKFADDYIQSNTTEIKGGATFGASGYSEVKDNGDVVVKIGGDATLDISKEYIHWDKNHSANYDITVKSQIQQIIRLRKMTMANMLSMLLMFHLKRYTGCYYFK